MSERPTPDTDAVLARLVKNRAGNSCDAVVIHHARKLERERDEAREQYDALATEHMLVVNKLCNERNEAREALASREVVIAQQNVITDLILEREEARSVLQEIEAARWHTACELRRIATRALADLTIPTK